MTNRPRAVRRRRSAQRALTDSGVLAWARWMLARSRGLEGPSGAAGPGNLAAAVAEAAFEHCPAGLVVTDADARILRVNPAFARLAGFGAEDLVGRDPESLTAERQEAGLQERLRQGLVEFGRWEGEVWNRRPDGSDYPAELAVESVCGDQGQPLYQVRVYRDISGFKAAEAELDRVANSDALTGLPNRRLLAERLCQAVAAADRSGRTLALCYLDLDGFKSINDTHGHATGDSLLVTVARRLLGVMRESDTLARLGGDEFALIFNGFTQDTDIEAVLGRVLAAVAAPVRVGPVRLQVSASMGVTTYPGDSGEPELLLKHADLALYRAKGVGGARFVRYDPGLERGGTARPRMAPRLARALAQREFRLRAEPRIDLLTNAVVGAEGRLHWQHPRRGLRPAGEFLSAVTGTDLDLAIGDWMIDAALSQLDAWRAAGLRLTLAVGLSPHCLFDGDLPVRLGRALVRHPGVEPRALEILIPEAVVLADPIRIGAILRACRTSGVALTLDGFGAAGTALTFVRSLPVDRLKLDPGLVRAMIDDPGDLDAVESALRLAAAFEREIVAAGVESLEQAALFVRLGGSLAQGPGISPLLATTDFPGWLERWSSAPAWLQMDRRVSAREDVSLMVAAASHRRWIAGLVQYLDDPRGTDLVAVSSRECRFGHWYHGRGRLRYGDLPEFQAIDPLHEEIHRLGGELVRLCRSGRVTAAWARLSDLYGLRDRLLAEIDALIARGADGAEPA